MKIVVIAALTLLLSLAAQPAASQAVDDRLIVPGVRIGKWTVAMTIDDLLRLNGPRNGAMRPALDRVVSADAQNDLWEHRWDSQGITAITIGRDSLSVAELATLLEQFKTDKGIGPGCSKETVQSAYGTPTAVTAPGPSWWTGVYDQLGMTVQIFPADIARHVTVFPPGTARRLYRLP